MKSDKRFEVIKIEAFGVKIGIFCDDAGLKERISEILPIAVPRELKFIEDEDFEHIFTIEKAKDSVEIFIRRNDEEEFTHFTEDDLLEYLSSQIRITVAEFAKSKVFIHAGAVGWHGVGIIIPGQSYSGKTTLVSELIKLGAEYYSDEYAVLDEKGFLHPYPKMLSMRGIINDWDQVDTAPEQFGAAIGKQIIPVGMVLITKYEERGKWKPEVLNSGEGVLEILRHTIPIRNNPEFVLKVLKKTISRAIIAKSKRGTAHKFAPVVLKYLESALK